LILDLSASMRADALSGKLIGWLACLRRDADATQRAATAAMEER
jgi:hypothetical protein